MNNDKTKSRQREGREPSEKAIFIRYTVCRWMRTCKLGRATANERMVATSILSCFRNSVNNWLANQESSKMERMR